MPLTDKERAAVSNWITEKVPEYRCLFCGSDQWKVAPRVALLPVADGPQFCMAFAIVQCGECARVEYFDAETVGLRPPFH